MCLGSYPSYNPKRELYIRHVGFERQKSDKSEPLMQTVKDTSKLRQFSLSLFIPWLLLTADCLAQSESNYKRSISDIDKEIKTLSRNINANKSKFETEQSKLLSTEREVAKIEQKLVKARAEMVQTKSLIQELEQKQAELVLQQKNSRESLTRLIVSNYKNGVPNRLKMLLNQEDPYSLGRLNNYHSYFSEAITERFNQLAKEVEKGRLLRITQQIKVAELQSIEQEQEFLRKQKQNKNEQRRKLLDRLMAKVTNAEEKIIKLRTDRDRLNQLLKELEKQKAELARIENEREEAEKRAIQKAKREGKKPPKKKYRKPVRGGFAKQKGRLACPVEELPKTKFGQRIVSSGMVSEGVFYDTKVSLAVRSIFRGQILFADFLKGFGLLIIVDHGDDHISLYGHNEVLYKKVGDAVETNEVISKSGKTGGLKSNGLYFEIRRNTTPVNPLSWCQ